VVTAAGNAGLPATGRGYYFSKDDQAFFSFSAGFVLNHSFSVHTWLYPVALGTAMTVFSKDRDDFAAATNKNLLSVYVKSDGALAARLAQDIDATNYAEVVSSGSIAAEEWT
jgi:hypothetical protein